MSPCKIFVAGHLGMVRVGWQAAAEDQPMRSSASREKLDLTNQTAVNDFLAQHKFDQVYLAAAKWAAYMRITPTNSFMKI